MNTLSVSSEAEVCAAVRDAASTRAPLLVEGGGTKRELGRPAQSERTLSCAGLTGITLYEPAEMVFAHPGTPLAEVDRALATKHQQLAFEPMDHRPLLGTAGEPTIGAVAVANISGPRRVHSGAARDSLIGVRFVNGLGQAIKSGGRVMKNVTGLDLVKLISGSWGTLGVLTEVTFKVLPRPERATTLLLRGLEEHEAAAAMSAALTSPYEVSAAAHLPARLGGGAQTLLRVEGLSFSVAHRMTELRRMFRRHDLDLVEDDTSAALWRNVRDVAPFASDHPAEAVWRISTAPTKGHAFTAVVARSLECRWFYDWGGGLVWLACPAQDDAGAAAIRTALAAVGGHATLVRAPAEIRASADVFQPMGEPLRRLSAGIKAAFDPHGILNPGRMYAGI